MSSQGNNSLDGTTMPTLSQGRRNVSSQRTNEREVSHQAMGRHWCCQDAQEETNHLLSNVRPPQEHKGDPRNPMSTTSDVLEIPSTPYLLIAGTKQQNRRLRGHVSFNIEKPCHHKTSLVSRRTHPHERAKGDMCRSPAMIPMILGTHQGRVA